MKGHLAISLKCWYCFLFCSRLTTNRRVGTTSNMWHPCSKGMANWEHSGSPSDSHCAVGKLKQATYKLATFYLDLRLPSRYSCACVSSSAWLTTPVLCVYIFVWYIYAGQQPIVRAWLEGCCHKFATSSLLTKVCMCMLPGAYNGALPSVLLYQEQIWKSELEIRKH